MAYGPIYPFDDYIGGAGGNVGSLPLLGAGGNAAAHWGGYAVVPSLGADSTIELRFNAPTASLPSGTPYLRYKVMSLASSTSVAKFTASVGFAAYGAVLSGATLNALSQTTVNFSASTPGEILSADLNLTTALSGYAADNLIDVAIKFQTSGWTVASQTNWIFGLVWY